MEESHIVCKTLCEGSDEEVIVTAFDIKLTRKDLQSLSNPNWLNDQVINLNFSLIKEECNNTLTIQQEFSPQLEPILPMEKANSSTSK